MYPKQIYESLLVEQAERIKTKEAYYRLEEEVTRRIKATT